MINLTPPHYTNSQNSMISFDYSWFVAKNSSNFVSLPWKLHNRYCHSVQYSRLRLVLGRRTRGHQLTLFMAFSGLQSQFYSLFIFSLYFFLTVGWASDGARGFGEQAGVKTQILNIIHSTRTIMRSKLNSKFIFIEYISHQFYK